jgi:pimeloyl-ACP methyl ester carboxylesterase
MSSSDSFTTVLLPGLACDAEIWREQLGALSRYRPQVSDVHSRAGTLPDMAAALLAAHPGELVLAGASMGGRIAMEAARQAPHRLRGLAVLGSSARADSEELRALRSEAVARFEAGELEDVLKANVWFVFHRCVWDDEALLERYRAMVRRAGIEQLVRQNRAMTTAPDLRDGLGALRCPTLVVCGDGDRVTPPECSREIAQAIAGARLELLADCGHMLTMEKPAELNALLVDWLAALAA